MVAGQKQLFLDDLSIAQMQGLTRTLHQVAKSPLNPVIATNYPWEYTLEPTRGNDRGGVASWGGAVWIPDEQVYKCWYSGRFSMAGRGVQIPEAFDWLPTSLAVSRDGVYWEKPFTRIVSWNGSTENNLVSEHGLLDVIYDPRDPIPERRYKALGVNLTPEFGAATYTSPDGLHWTGPLTSIRSQDEYHLMYDDIRRQYVAMVKCYNPSPETGLKWGRAVGVATSPDFDTWTEPVFVFGADEQDIANGRLRNEAATRDPSRLVSSHNDPAEWGADIYSMPVFTYEGLYIGMPSLFNHFGPAWGNQAGQCNVELTVSRDLLTWERVCDRAIFIPVGPREHFDAGFVWACAYPQIHGDEIWFYYSGLPTAHDFEKVSDEDSGVGLSVLRLDGFVSLDAGEAEGTLLTQPLVPAGPELYLNLDAPSGEARVEVLDADGSPIAGLSGEACMPAQGDDVSVPVRWRGDASLAAVVGQPVQLRIHLRNAKLYAFWAQ